MNKRDIIILYKIRDESTIIKKMIYDIDESAFLIDDVKIRAVCMTLINIGELVKNLSNEFKFSHPFIPWKDIAGFRDIAAHGYFTLRMPDVWIYASEELPVLTEDINRILIAEKEDCDNA